VVQLPRLRRLSTESFQDDFADWYTSAGYSSIPWLELLDLQKRARNVYSVDVALADVVSDMNDVPPLQPCRISLDTSGYRLSKKNVQIKGPLHFAGSGFPFGRFWPHFWRSRFECIPSTKKVQ
jgi:hypothetical protein